MRKILFILAMVVSLSASLSSAQERCDRRHGGRHGYEHRDRHHRSPYLVSENKVYFDGREIKGASASNFTILRDGYARNNWKILTIRKKLTEYETNDNQKAGGT